MSTDTIFSINSTNSEDTERIGERLGRHLKGGEVIELVSDLGGGKTTFVHGIVKGVGSTDKVSSPSFTISKVYNSNKFEIVHFDFYRLKDVGLMEHELQDILNDQGVVVIVEWGDVARHVLPEQRLSIEFIKTDDSSRLLKLNCPEKLKYLLAEIC